MTEIKGTVARVEVACPVCGVPVVVTLHAIPPLSHVRGAFTVTPTWVHECEQTDA